jgi:hypothetical protein
MRLHRVTKKGDTKYCENRKTFQPSDGNEVMVPFQQFGEDSEWRMRWPHFKVGVEWKDVEALIATFSGMGNPKARRIKRALKLASALEVFMKKQAGPQSN